MQEQKSPIIRNKGKLEINWLKERPKFKGGKVRMHSAQEPAVTVAVKNVKNRSHQCSWEKYAYFG